MNRKNQYKVYLAGPDVFRPDAKEHGRLMVEACDRHGLDGMFPLDNEIAVQFGSWQSGLDIFQANTAMMDRADAVLVNMDRFRGPSMDVGTAYEMGYCSARRIPVFGYREHPTLAYRDIVEELDAGYSPEDHTDGRGLSVEHFNMPDNLMVVGAAVRSGITIYGSFEEALTALATHLRLIHRLP